MNAVKQIQTGLSLIELMVTLAVVAIVSVTTVPAMNKFVVNHELRSAQEDVATVLRKAKHLARTQNTNISVAFVQDTNTVRLILPNADVLQTINMGKVSVDATITFQFRSIGTVTPIDSVNLVSERDTTKSKTVRVNSLFGQITLS